MYAWLLAMNNLYFVIKLFLLYQIKGEIDNIIFVEKEQWTMLGIEPDTSVAEVKMLIPCDVRAFIAKPENEL